MKKPAVYILSSGRNATLYIGVSSDLLKRVYQHKQHLLDGFTRKHNVCELVYFEMYDDMATAISREKQIKKWKRNWKLELIEKTNPDWEDLSEDLL